MIDQKLRPVWWKNRQFHLNMNIEGRIWRHAVTSWYDVFRVKTNFGGRIDNDVTITDVKLRLYWKIIIF